MALQTLFTFDDVLISPSRSSIEPREASLRAVFVSGIELSTPFISAAMDRVTEDRMAIALHEAGGIGVLHRNCSIEKQIEMVRKVKAKKARAGAACGPFDMDRAIALKKAGIDFLVIDCAHGHNAKVIASARQIRRKIGKLPLIIGNIATAEAVRDLKGIADAVKVGIGPGSICTTRIVSGVGMPQLSAIMQVVGAARKIGMRVIADGGMRTSGDIAKALAAGADAVMLGSMFAGAEETPGEVLIKKTSNDSGEHHEKYKEYRGMGSAAVMKENMSADRYLVSGRKAVSEGVEATVPYKGKVADLVAELASGIQVAMGYVGAKNLSEFKRRAKFIRITNATLQENNPHILS